MTPAGFTSDISPLVLTADVRQIVEYAGASGDFYPMHYDLEFATALGHRDLAVHGLMKAAILGRLLEQRFPLSARVKVLEVRYTELDFRHEPIAFYAKVVNESRSAVTLDIWTENAEKRITTTGYAEVALDVPAD